MVKISWGKVCQENLDIFRACSSGILIFFRDIRFRKGDSGLYGGGVGLGIPSGTKNYYYEIFF